MAVTYSPILVALLFAIGFALVFLALAMFIGPKHETAEKLAPFECGSEPIGSPRVRFSVKFYQVAILFVALAIETALLYPWAVLYRRLSCTGEVTMRGVHSFCHGGVSLFGLAEIVPALGVRVAAL